MFRETHFQSSYLLIKLIKEPKTFETNFMLYQCTLRLPSDVQTSLKRRTVSEKNCWDTSTELNAFLTSGQSPRPPNESVLIILTETVEMEINLNIYIIIVIFTTRINLSI